VLQQQIAHHLLAPLSVRTSSLGSPKGAASWYSHLTNQRADVLSLILSAYWCHVLALCPRLIGVIKEAVRIITCALFVVVSQYVSLYASFHT